jgi:hypothetical protein
LIVKIQPAVLIGRLGVNEKYKGNKISSQVLDFVKAWFKEKITKLAVDF